MGSMPKHQSCQSHCCAHHGCKYSHSDCPVVTGEVLQDYGCERCPDLNWRNMEAGWYEAPIGSQVLFLEKLETGYMATFLTQKKAILDQPLKLAQICAAAFAESLIVEMHNALSPF